MKEGESADSGSDTPSSADDLMEEMLDAAEAEAKRLASSEEAAPAVDFNPDTGRPTEESLAELRAEAIRRPVEEARERQRELEAWKRTKGDRSNPWRYRESWDNDEPFEKRLGDHSATEGMSASETRELIDAVSSENGHMSGNHAPKYDPAPNAEHGFKGGKRPGDGSVDAGLVDDDAAAPNHFETRAATRIGNKHQRASRSGSVDYEELARHNDGRSGAWSDGVDESYSEWSVQQDKTSIAETYCSHLELTPLQTQRIVGIIERLDFDKFGSQKRLEKVTLATVQADSEIDIDHYEHLREDSGDDTDDENHSPSRSAVFKQLREGQDMSLSDLKKLTAKVKEQL